MSSASEAVKGLVAGVMIGLGLTFVVGLVGVVLAHFCVWPVAPWCGW